MMEHDHEKGSDKTLESHLELKHDDHGSTQEAGVVSIELNPEIKHKENYKQQIEGAIVQPEPKNKPTEDGTSLGLEAIADSKDVGDHLNIKGSSSDFSNSSSSSSSSSDEEEDPLDDSFLKSHSDVSRSESTSSPDISTQNPQWSMISASPRAGTGNLSSPENLPGTPEWSMYSPSPMKPPHIQTMGHGYDPNRIPSSVFSTKPTTPMEWSVASNESLFSIQIDNNSFSRDNAILMGDSKPEEWSNSISQLNIVPEVKSYDSNSFTSSLPPVLEVAAENDKKHVDMSEVSGREETQYEMPKAVPAETVKDKEKSAPVSEQVHLSTTSSNLSESGGVSITDGAHTSAVSAARISNESENSCASFAFPLLTGEGGKSCSMNVIPKNETEEPKPQGQTHDDPPASASKAAETTNWYAWFCCWHRCC